MLTEKEFKVLNAVRRMPGASQRAIAQDADISLGIANSILKRFKTDGLVDANTHITSTGMAALQPHKVDNAIIMAAGLSSRFAPISYEKPKGMLNVRGEVLIERQIRQLQEAGISHIAVVVGYKKEYFFYLEDAFGVKIIVNDEYASRNNNSTLNVVKELLGNSYLCSSDNYFMENPFEDYVWKAYYAVEYSEGPTQEWCITTERQGLIKSVTVGGSDTWYMIGHAYLDRAFSKRFVEILNDEYDLPQTAEKLWEDLFIEHIDDLEMVARKYPPATIFEFDTLDELREFDPFFLDNVDSSAFNHIVEVLDCAKSDVHDIFPLKQGLTNLSCHFRTSEGEYVYRHPGIGTDKIIDRIAEMKAQETAKRLGIDDTFIAGSAEKGWKISRFIPNCQHLDPHDDAQLAEAMHIARKLHAEEIELERSFDFYQEAKSYEALLREHGPIEVHDFEDMATIIDNIQQHLAQEQPKKCLTHNDFFYLNLLRDEKGKLYLIDWEYAGMGDYANDFGTFTVTCELSEEEALRALQHYFGREPTFEELRHNLAHVALAGWCWYVWALAKEAEGAFVGEWLYIYYNYAKHYMTKVQKMFENETE